jgi:nicotinic acid phosphoribosyltransferase
VITNLALRAHDHNWELDPITRSLLDTNFDKLLVLQFSWKQFPKTRASFSFINRSVETGEGAALRASSVKPILAIGGSFCFEVLRKLQQCSVPSYIGL